MLKNSVRIVAIWCCIVLTATALQGCSLETSDLQSQKFVQSAEQKHAVPDPQHFPLEERLAAIDSAFRVYKPVNPAVGRKTLACQRATGEFLVRFYPSVTVNSVNAGRSALANGTASTQLYLPSGQLVNTTMVVPTTVRANLAQELPAVTVTQDASRLIDNRDCPALARFLQQRYGIALRREIYYGSCRVALFSVPDATALQLAKRLQKENSDFVAFVEPNCLAYPDSYFPRALDESLDDLTPIGPEVAPSGCVPSLNGPNYWNYGEGYGYFQSNAHRMHTCYFGATYIGGQSGPGITANAFYGDSGISPNHPDLPDTSPGWPPSAIRRPVDPANPANMTYWDCTNDNWTWDEKNDSLRDDPDFKAHGTKVAGVIGARQGDGQGDDGITGIIPYGGVYPFKLFPEGTPLTDQFTIMEGVLRAFDCRALVNSYVLNLSLGWAQYDWDGVNEHPVNYMPALGSALSEAGTDPRFAIVCGAMNDGHQTSAPDIQHVLRYGPEGVMVAHWPAAFAYYPEFPHVISVMAVAEGNESRSGFSCWEHFSAPGSVNLSGPGGDDGVGTLSTCSTPQYESFNGTSCAAPHVTGLVAMIQAYHPGLTANLIRTHISTTPRARNMNWDGWWLDFDVKPIMNCDASMTWIDITNPSHNPDDPVLPVLQAQYIEAHFKCAQGQIADNLQTASVSFFLEDPDVPYVQLLGTAYSPFTNDYNYRADKARVYFDPTNYPQFSGPVKLTAKLDVSSSPSGRILWTQPVNCRIP